MRQLLLQTLLVVTALIVARHASAFIAPLHTAVLGRQSSVAAARHGGVHAQSARRRRPQHASTTAMTTTIEPTVTVRPPPQRYHNTFKWRGYQINYKVEGATGVVCARWRKRAKRFMLQALDGVAVPVAFAPSLLPFGYLETQHGNRHVCAHLIRGMHMCALALAKLSPKNSYAEPAFTNASPLLITHARSLSRAGKWSTAAAHPWLWRKRGPLAQ